MSKPRVETRNNLTVSIVFLLMAMTLLLGFFGLMATGIFDKVEPVTPLVGTTPLDLPTPPPQRSAFSWLFTSATAEEALAKPETEEDLDTLLSAIIQEERATLVVADEDRVIVKKNDYSQNEALSGEWLNVLLLATDERDMTLRTGRTDVMIVASLNAKTGEVKLTSLARDLYVPITTKLGSNRLNTAFTFGGPELAMKVINEVFQLNIGYYVLVNFEGMAAIVDALGGVTLPLVGMEYYYINYNVAVSEDYEGFAQSGSRRTLTAQDADTDVHLDGLQAVSYARIRKLDNDLGRNSRQRILLSTLIDTVMGTATPSTLASMTVAIMPYTRLNIPLGTIIATGIQYLSSGRGITLADFSVPMEGTWRADTVQGYGDSAPSSVIICDMQKNVQALHEFIYGEYVPVAK